MILAGGLDPASVAGALLAVPAVGVDVASGVEAPRVPGERPRKDPLAVALLAKRARAARFDRPNAPSGPTPVHPGLLEADARGHWGVERDFGGRFVPETLVGALEQLEAAYAALRHDPVFWAELRDLLAHFAGPPDRPLPRRPAGGGGPGGVRAPPSRPRHAGRRPPSRPASASTSSARTSPTPAPTRSTTPSVRRCLRTGSARPGSSPRPAPASTASPRRPPARSSACPASSTWARRTSGARRPTSCGCAPSAPRSAPSRPARRRSRTPSTRRCATGSRTSRRPTTSWAARWARTRTRRSCATSSAGSATRRRPSCRPSRGACRTSPSPASGAARTRSGSWPASSASHRCGSRWPRRPATGSRPGATRPRSWAGRRGSSTARARSCSRTATGRWSRRSAPRPGSTTRASVRSWPRSPRPAGSPSPAATDREAVAAMKATTLTEGILPALETAHAIAALPKLLAGSGGRAGTATRLARRDARARRLLGARRQGPRGPRAVRRRRALGGRPVSASPRPRPAPPRPARTTRQGPAASPMRSPAARADGRVALIPYIVAGYPDADGVPRRRPRRDRRRGRPARGRVCRTPTRWPTGRPSSAPPRSPSPPAPRWTARSTWSAGSPASGRASRSSRWATPTSCWAAATAGSAPVPWPRPARPARSWPT